MAIKPSIIASLRAELESQRERYKAYLTRRCEDGNFFHFFRDYLKVMSLEEAAVLQSIVNMGRGNSTNDGWILCTDAHLEKSLGIRRRARDRVVGVLVTKTFLETKLRGNPAKRHVRPDLVAVEEAIDRVSVCTELYEQDCTHGEQTRSYRTVRDKEKTSSSKKTKNSPSAAPPPSGVSGKESSVLFEEPEPDKLHLALAQRLRDWTVKNKSNLSIPTRWSPQTWTNDMRILADSVGLDAASQRLDYLLTNNPSAVTPGLPTPVNAKIFRSAAVQTWIMKHMEKSGAVANGAVATPADQKLVDEIMRLDWSMSKRDKIRPTVYPAVLGSRDQCSRYAVWARSVTVKKHDIFRERVIREVSGWDGKRQDAIVVHWFRLVAAEVADWDRWQGDLRKLPLHRDQKMFDKFWTDGMGLPASELPKFKEEVARV